MPEATPSVSGLDVCVVSIQPAASLKIGIAPSAPNAIGSAKYRTTAAAEFRNAAPNATPLTASP